MIVQNKKNKSQYGIVPKPENDELINNLPKGVYNLNFITPMMGSSIIVFDKYEPKEKIIEPSQHKEYSEIKKEVLNFLNPKLIELYSDLKYLNKKGIAVHGKPGTGKTASITNLISILCENTDTIALIVKGQENLKGVPYVIDRLREDDDNKDRCIILLFDECEPMFKFSEYLLLELLDGPLSKNNVLSVFITNFIDKIPSRFTDRPSRIRKIFEYNSAPYEVIKQILEKKIPEKYQGYLDIEKLAYKYSEDKKTIDEAKTEVVEELEKMVLESEDLTVKHA